MKMLSSLYSTRSFELVHDMFTVDRRRVAAFCEAMISSGEGFTWSCSARTDCVDEHLLELMARSGCEGIFYGVEVGSKKMQKAIDKHLDLERAEEIIYATERLGIRSTVSLITGFPEESWDDFKGTISMYMNAVRCAKSKPQLNLLAPLAETPLHSKYRDQLILEDLCSEMSHQARSQADADIQLIKCYPEIFPNFYIIPTADLDWSQLLEFREFVLTGTARFRWLLLAIHSTADHLAEFFLDWRARRLEVRPQLRGPSLRHYYRTIEFRAEFLGFVGSHEKCGNEVIQALLDYEDVLRQCVADCGMLRPAGLAVPIGHPLSWDDIPLRTEGTLIIELPYNIQNIIDALKTRAVPSWERGSFVYLSRETSSARAQVLQISNWMACILLDCNGKMTIEDIVSHSTIEMSGVDDSERTYILLRLLQKAHAERYIEIYRMTSDAELSQSGGGTECEYDAISDVASEQNHFLTQSQ